jgi:lipoate synthase
MAAGHHSSLRRRARNSRAGRHGDRPADLIGIDIRPAIAQILPVPSAVDTRSRRLRVLGQSTLVNQDESDQRPHHPPWIRARLPTGKTYLDLRARVHQLGLHTVCESASCPNVGECWSEKALTIMILGGLCTRSCKFCDVPTGKPLPPDPDEPDRVATILGELGLQHTVITCVTRDDLEDGGAAHWAATIRAVKAVNPSMILEVLVSDFKGEIANVDVVLDAAPDVRCGCKPASSDPCACSRTRASAAP